MFLPKNIPSCDGQLFFLFRFDFFLILSKDCFTEVDAWLAKELRERKKGFFFIRTFLDMDLEKWQRDNGLKIKEKNEEDEITTEMENFMEKVREYCLNKLQFNTKKVHVYLVSNWFPNSFEFSKLALAMSNHFSEFQREAFLFSLKVGTTEIFKAKKEALRKRILYAAFTSGVANAIPIPGTDLVADIAVLMREIAFFKKIFSLDTSILNTRLENDKITSLLSTYVSIGNEGYVMALLAKSVTLEIVEESTKLASWAAGAGLTSFIAGAASFGSTYYILTRELDKIAKLSNDYLKIKLEKMVKKAKIE